MAAHSVTISPILLYTRSLHTKLCPEIRIKPQDRQLADNRCPTACGLARFFRQSPIHQECQASSMPPSPRPCRAPTTTSGQMDQLRKTPGGELCAVGYLPPNRANKSQPRQSPMTPKPHAVPKMQLVLEHTIAGRAVFYCVPRETPDPKPATSGIKNRLAPQHQNPHSASPSQPIHHAGRRKSLANSPTPDTRHLTPSPPPDIEPHAKLPYIDGLAEHSRL